MGDIDNGKMRIFGISDSHGTRWLWEKTFVTMIEPVSIFTHTFLSDLGQEGPKVLRVRFDIDWHFVSGTLDVSFKHQHVFKVDLKFAVRFREDLIWILHVVLISREAVANQHRQRILVSSSRTPALLAKVGNGVGKSNREHTIQRSDVYTKLQSGSCNDAKELAVKHLSLDLSPVLWGIATSVGHDPPNNFCSFEVGQLRLDCSL